MKVASVRNVRPVRVFRPWNAARSMSRLRLENMTRKTVRTLKRAALAAGRPGATETDRILSGECALALLTRSIRFAHGRLAVLRLAMAVDAGASIPREHWLYCSRVAGSSTDVTLQEIYRTAAVKASQVHGSACMQTEG
jgi:hypothetical protein